MAMCPVCGCCEGHFQGCVHIDDEQGQFFPENKQTVQMNPKKKRKYFGTENPENNKGKPKQ